MPITATDYKALVCVFLTGGNDHNATLVPFDTPNYDKLRAIRGNLTPAQSDLAATALTSPQPLAHNLQYALHPRLTRMKAMFDAGKLATVLNVGPLVEPLTVAQYYASGRKPAKLFSHNDQQSTWQAYGPEGATEGWGGRIGDLALSNNANPLFTCVSVTGSTPYLAGKTALTYQISPTGAPSVKGLKAPLYNSSLGSAALRNVMTKQGNHLFEAEYNKIAKRSIDAEGLVNSALRPITLNTQFAVPNERHYLAEQLELVAKLIAARQTLGAKRQVFMVSLGGFDHHDNLSIGHSWLMGQLDFALDAFYKSTVELGVADKVTTFTASDFGRTLQINGDGSDHGWGSHHFIIGGAVKGGKFYGTAPEISLTGNEQIGGGVLLPTIAVDQYATTLASWFGVPAAELPTVAPNIGRFAGSNLGFMA